MPQPYTLREATPADQIALSDLITYEYYVHRHLDWRQPLEWLGCQPFYVLQGKGQRLYAALACPTDPPEAAWIRLFAVSALLDLQKTWKELLETACRALPTNPSPQLAALSLHSWMSDLLEATGFLHSLDIVVLEWQGRLSESLPSVPNLAIRKIEAEDLPVVAHVDRCAFAPLWQNSLDALQRSLTQSGYASVAEIDGQIVGYQITTHGLYSAHLARLAVLPEWQRLHLGRALVQDLQQYYHGSGTWNLTVNTQSDNLSSLTLYEKLGFHPTGDRFPVYIYNP
jgi:ribosomal protein S18 acetylase RimI-like enzyme